MRRHRTTARGIVASLLLIGLAVAASASAAVAKQDRSVPRLVFPLVAQTQLWDNYGDPRGNGRHAGIDMENPWRAPVVAVEDGRVKYWSSGLGGCMLYHYGRSGTTYLYIHLNNDLTRKNDNKGGCVRGVAYAVSNGAKVTAGQQIGFNGDSGDASGNPHLHFEVHPKGKGDANPYPHLARAVKPLFGAKEGSVFSLGLGGKVVALGADTVSVEVDRVRRYPGGKWLDVDTRTVELAVPLGVDLPSALARASDARLRSVRTPMPVTAFTLKANATREAILGAPRELLLGRVAPGSKR